MFLEIRHYVSVVTVRRIISLKEKCAQDLKNDSIISRHRIFKGKQRKSATVIRKSFEGCAFSYFW